MHSLPVLLVESDQGRRVLTGSAAAFRAAFAAFVEAWGAPAVWFDPEARMIGSDGGVRLGRWRARRLGIGPGLALVVSSEGSPSSIYLVDDGDAAERVVLALAWRDAESMLDPRLAFDLVPLEVLPDHMDASAADPLAGELGGRGLRVRRLAGRRPFPPRGSLDLARLCPRCEDHPLHAEPLLDGRAPDGTPICGACTALDDLRAAA